MQQYTTREAIGKSAGEASRHSNPHHPSNSGSSGSFELPRGLFSRSQYQALREIVMLACPVGLRQDLDCLVQMSAVKLWKQLEVDPERELSKSYLYRIATSTIIDEIRRRGAKKCSFVQSSSDTLENCATAPGRHWGADVGLERAAFGAKLRGCLNRLPDQQRVATLLFLQGHSNKEIARMLNWTEKKTENCRLRGRDSLRKCLRRKGLAQ